MKTITSTTEYEQSLKQVVKHQEYIPFIGSGFDKYRILLVGESHFLKGNIKYDIEKWYSDSSIPSEIEDYRLWFTTNKVVNNAFTNDTNTPALHSMFVNIGMIMSMLLPDHTGDISKQDAFRGYNHFAFMNYYQRPEFEQGNSIDCTQLDNEVAQSTLASVIKILNPSFVIFFSKKAYSNFNSEGINGVIIKRVSHPCSVWWNRKKKNGKSGSDDFKDLLMSVVKQ